MRMELRLEAHGGAQPWRTAPTSTHAGLPGRTDSGLDSVRTSGPRLRPVPGPLGGRSPASPSPGRSGERPRLGSATEGRRGRRATTCCRSACSQRTVPTSPRRALPARALWQDVSRSPPPIASYLAKRRTAAGASGIAQQGACPWAVVPTGHRASGGGDSAPPHTRPTTSNEDAHSPWVLLVDPLALDGGALEAAPLPLALRLAFDGGEMVTGSRLSTFPLRRRLLVKWRVHERHRGAPREACADQSPAPARGHGMRCGS